MKRFQNCSSVGKVLCLPSAAALGIAGTCHASPYDTPDLGAASSPEVSIGSTIEDSRSGGTLIAPSLDVTLPVSAGIEVAAAIGRGHIAGDGGADRWGWLDAEVAMKIELIPKHEDAGFGLSAEPAIVLPTGTQGIGEEDYSLIMPLVAGWSQSGWHIRATAGWEKNLSNGSDDFAFGMAVENKIGPAVTIGAEIVGGTISLGLDEPEIGANFGLRYVAAENVEFLARVGQSLKDRDGEKVRNVAITVLFSL